MTNHLQQDDSSEPRSDQNALTVVIVTYNCERFIGTCLRSVFAQASDVLLRVVVVDNASTDGTLAAINALQTPLTLIDNPANVGFGRACNQGMAAANAGHILILNPDTILPGGALLAAIRTLEALPRVGMLGCKLIREDGEPDHASKRSVPTPGSSLSYMLRLDRLPGHRFDSSYSGSQDFDKAESVEAISGAFMLVRRIAFEKTGGFDERFWMYGEDLDWCVRFRENGWEVYYWPGVQVVHMKGGSSGAARSLRVNWAFHEAMWIFYQKHQAMNDRRIVRGGVLAGISVRFILTAAVSAVRRSGRRTMARSHG